MRIVLLSFSLFCALIAKSEITLSDETVVDAGTLLVKLRFDPDIKRPERSYAAFEGKRYPAYPNPFDEEGGFYALVPVHYGTRPHKTKLVVVEVYGKTKHYTTFPVTIRSAHYRKERLHVDPSRAKISEKNRRRIRREANEAKAIYRHRTPRLYIDAPLSLPLQSKITSAFGTKRLFNGILKSFHSGTDFRAATGTPIQTVASGRVVLAKNRFFAGNSVIIDHGEGIYTGYYHLSRFLVKKGDFVHEGEIIGLAGATGRVTGPHLHFTVHVNATLVDPLRFIDTFNRLFF